MKAVEYWDTGEVALWLHCIGFNVESFLENSVDGEMLLSLSTEDLTNELGLEEIQAQKLLRSLEHSKSYVGGNNLNEKSEKEISELQEKTDYICKKLLQKEQKIEELHKEMAKLELTQSITSPLEEDARPVPQAPPEEAPYQPPPPQQPPQQQGRQGPGVVGGAAVGAAGGAMKGAIVGAIIPGMDAGDGATAGAAAGALGGAGQGFRNRRRR